MDGELHAGGAKSRFAVPREDVLAVERVAACPTRTSPVIVDGKLDEWSAFPQAHAAADAADARYQFAVEHDDKFVYIAVKTTDDKSVLNALKEPWSQDGVEIRFDARGEPQRSQGRGRGEIKEILVVSMSPSSDARDEDGAVQPRATAQGREGGVREDARPAMRRRSRFPASYLNERQGGAWKQFRMNVCVDDYDAVAGPLKRCGGGRTGGRRRSPGRGRSSGSRAGRDPHVAWSPRPCIRGGQPL